MGDIESVLPVQSQTVEAIYAWWESKGDAEKWRTYLGASVIGETCDRKLWYSFRWCGRGTLPGRMQRLFDHGNQEESRIINDLRAIGCRVETTGEDGGQFAVVSCDGHFRGHLDGAVLQLPEAPKTWHVLEAKTHNLRSFRQLTREGVRVSHPKHYAQMQIYMLLTGMDRALYFAVCKDDDNIHCERVHLDREYAGGQIERASSIIKAVEPPVFSGCSTDDDICRFCCFAKLCHLNPMGLAIPAHLSCRSCCYSDIAPEGQWHCRQHQKSLSYFDQTAACDSHLWLPGFISFAEAVNYGENPDGSTYVEYMNSADNSFWRHGSCKADGQFDSIELTKIPHSALHGPSAERIRNFREAKK